MVFNLSLSDFAGCPGSLADLAFASPHGEPLPHAEGLGQLLGLMTTLPSEVKANDRKNAPTIAPTFKEHETSKAQQKVQLVLEPLRSPFEPFHVVGLRLHVLLFDHHGVFPTLTSNLWQQTIATNQARRAKETARQPPAVGDPALASRNVTSMATLGKMWRQVVGNAVNGTKRTLKEWVRLHEGSVANVTFLEAVLTYRTELFLHRLSPEWILRLGSDALLLRTPMETSARQLDKGAYFTKESVTYTFPNPEDCLVYAGTTGALHARWPTKLANEILRAHEEYGGAGQSFHGTVHSEHAPVRPTRKRSRDLPESEESQSDTDSE